MSSSDPVADAELPDIDDRLVEPETPYERGAQRLDRWIVRAASCTQAAELFTEG